ncbi:MAG: NAD(P)H-binding protein [Myxococcota bacterium]
MEHKPFRPEEMSPVLLTGATGFVGRHVRPALLQAGYAVHCASRRPQRASSDGEPVRWVELDTDRPATMGPALSGVRSVLYLVHGMAGGGDYERRESEAARRFTEEADRAGVRRIVYLGGIAPMGRPSKHLRSRLATGDILRGGPVPTVELRAGMVVGAGSESWRIVRDLSMRLPAMLLPQWLDSRSQPIAIDDVVAALVGSLQLPDELVGCYDLPGPETLTAREILFRIARLRGMEPLAIRVPVLTPRLSSYWLRLVTRANFQVAQQLVDGLTSDLISPDDGFWQRMPEHERMGFNEAAQRALNEEESSVPLSGRAFEAFVRRVARHHQRQDL